MSSPQAQPEFDPGAVLLPGAIDPRALLSVWCLRKSVYPLAWIGIAAAAAVDRVDDLDMSQLDTFGEAVDALLSPLAGVVVAIGLRLVSALIALVLAYRVTLSAHAIRQPFETSRAAAVRAMIDHVHVTRAFRSLRWTRAVRQTAIDRLGAGGRGFEVADRMLNVANVVFLLAALVVISLVA